MKKDTPVNAKNKKAEMAVLIPNKIDRKMKNVTKNKVIS